MRWPFTLLLIAGCGAASPSGPPGQSGSSQFETPAPVDEVSSPAATTSASSDAPDLAVAAPLRVSGPPPDPEPPVRDLASSTDPWGTPIDAWGEGDSLGAVRAQRRLNAFRRCFGNYMLAGASDPQDRILCQCLCQISPEGVGGLEPSTRVRFPTTGDLELGFDMDESGDLERCVVARNRSNTEVECAPAP